MLAFLLYTIYSGDFNIDLLNNEENADIFGLFYAKYFYPVISIPTRVTYATAKCIDHIMVRWSKL